MIIKNIVSGEEVRTCGISKTCKNGVETSESFMERPKRVMIICGVHGDETAAISACYKYYKALKDNPVGHTSYKFIFLANENAVKNESREYQKPEEEAKNLNRAFIEEEDSFSELKTRIIDEIKLFQPDVVLDVHNSPYCANTVLVDYGPKSQLIYFLAKANKINPTLRPTTNFGTIKTRIQRLKKRDNCDEQEILIRDSIDTGKDDMRLFNMNDLFKRSNYIVDTSEPKKFPGARTIRVAMDDSYYPISFMDIKTRTAQGYDKSILKDFAEYKGYNIEFLLGTYTSNEQLLRSGKVDFMCEGSTILEKQDYELAGLYCTDSIYIDDMYINKKNDNKYNYYPSLTLRFIGDVHMPEWMATKKINRLKIYGNISTSERKKILSWYKQSDIHINRARYLRNNASLGIQLGLIDNLDNDSSLNVTVWLNNECNFYDCIEGIDSINGLYIINEHYSFDSPNYRIKTNMPKEITTKINRVSFSIEPSHSEMKIMKKLLPETEIVYSKSYISFKVNLLKSKIENKRAYREHKSEIRKQNRKAKKEKD